MRLTRPVLLALNGMANWCLRRVGVQAVDEVSNGRSSEDLRHLLEHSARAGALDPQRHGQLAAALEIHSRPLREIVRPRGDVVGVATTALVAEIQAAAHASGHLRLVVWNDTEPLGVVHVRDTLTARPGTTAADLRRPVLTLPASTPIYAALGAMRERRSHLALVTDDTELVGIVTLEDLLEPLLTADSGAIGDR